MDLQDIREMVDEFIEQMRAEFVGFSEEMHASVEEAGRELKSIGLSVEEDAFLMMNMVDPGAMLQKRQERCKAHIAHIFEAMSELDSHDEREARRMIIENLREFDGEIKEFLFPSS